MSDAPIAYFSGDKAIFRASAANKCTKALVASLLSYSPVPPPADMQRRFDLGHKHEPTILAHVAALPGWHLYGAQEEFSFPIGEQIQVNCHPDSLATHPDHGMAIVESKALAPSGYANWVKHKFSAFEDYAIQQAVQWEAIPGVQMVVMAVGKKSADGDTIEEIDVSYFMEPPYSINKVKAHLIKAAKLGRDGVLPESCDRSNYPCFAAGTLVLTQEGYRPIEEIQVGEMVLTHLGRWQPVTKTTTTPNREVRTISTYGSSGLVVTDNHPFLTRERYYHHFKAKTSAVRRFTDAEWTPAEKLQRGLFVSQVVPPVDDIAPSLTPAQWWVIGRWVADGWTHSETTAMVCAGKHKTLDLETKLAESGWKWSRQDGRTAIRYRMNKEVRLLVDEYGKYAHGKRLPGYVFSLPKEAAEELLAGYLSGDGCRQPGFWIASTASKELAYGLALLAHQARGIVASVTMQRRSPTTVIEGRTVNQRTRTWCVRIPDENRNAFTEEGIGWKPVYASNPLNVSTTVYDLTVEEDHSFMAEGVLVHNCPFVYLETKDEPEAPVFVSENAVEIAEAASSYTSAAAIEKAAAKDKADARAVLLDLLGDGDRAEAGGFRVRRDKRKTTSRDWKGIKAAGIDLSPFEEVSYTDQLTVEEVG